MPVAKLRIAPVTEQVRLARLVAGAAARRCGVSEDVLDEVRLAVGEACARAVIRQQALADKHDVVIELEDSPVTFTVRVSDDAREGDDQGDLALAIISALAPESTVKTDENGSIVDMAWPIEGPS